MKLNIRNTLTAIVSCVLLLAAPQVHAAKNGQTAPDFRVKDIKGKEYALADLKGKNVILEWHNRECPFVKKHYESGNMQKLQKALTAKGFVWLTIISSAKGKQGYVTPAEENTYLKEQKAAPTTVLMDADGKMGKAYAAKTTPHMFIIDKKGVLVYQGAIDSNDSPDPETISSAKNYITTAADELLAGKPISTASTKPYGCSVKYE